MKNFFTTLLLLACYSSGFSQSSIANGSVCPNITITDTKGNAHKLYDYCTAGKYVLIDFYAYWCGPCMATAPKIDEFYKKYGCNSGNVIVLGNECDAAGTLSDLHGFDASAGIDTANSYPTTYGTIGGAANGTTYGIAAYPTIILVGPDKKMINNDVWPVSSVADIESKFPVGAITPKACAAPTSVNSMVDASISVLISPNPVSNMLTISSKSITGLVIYNQVGSRVMSFENLNNITSKSIDLSTISKGIYMVEIKTTNGSTVRKITKD